MISNKKDSIELKVILKAAFLLASAPIVVVFLLVATRALDLSYGIYAIFCIFMASAIIIRPYLSNILTLTNYVDDIANDRRVDVPDLSFITEVGNLSKAVKNLQRSWERKKQLMEAMQSEREILVDTIPDLLVMIDSEMNVVRSNSAARQRFGQNLAGKKLSDVIPNKDLDSAVSEVMIDLKGRELEFYLPDPFDCYYRAKIERFPVYSRGGLAVIITIHDITELKRTEQMRADFVANASHEIRTPLASIIGFIETLEGPAKDDAKAREQFLKIMSEQATRMSKLVNDLLSLSKIEMNVSSVPEGQVEIDKILETVRKSSEWQAKQRNVEIELRISRNLPKVRGEETELVQVFQNLVENAIKYGNSDSRVEIKAFVTRDIPKDRMITDMFEAVCISVRDYGEGIAKEHIPRLTERFYRVDTARSRKIGGTGLGLAIVKHIINRHKGIFYIESELGDGSTFTVYLPI